MKPSDAVRAYEDALAPEVAPVVRTLREEIERALPAATSKVWHGHPVWFDGENPLVGYDVRKDVVTLLFWNGQALGEPGLRPIGKHRAAGKALRTLADIDEAELRRCLDKARTNVFDSVAFFRAQREKGRRAREGA